LRPDGANRAVARNAGQMQLPVSVMKAATDPVARARILE
jgi:hypothetical protein